MGTSAFRHPALLYRGSAEFLAGTVPFVRAGLDAGEAVAVAVPPSNLALLAGGLGAAAGAVHFLDMAQVGRNPGRLIPGVLGAFADVHPGRRVRIVGEPIWPGRSELEYPACVQHEALVNRAFAGRPVTIMCPYDVDGLDPAVVSDAAATHPVLIEGDRVRPSDDYRPDAAVAKYNRPLPEPAGPVASYDVDVDDLAGLRRFVGAAATGAGMPPERRDDLELMVNELAGNAVRHGDGTGVVLIWADGPNRVGCEVTSGGRITDPLAGRRPVGPREDGGRGLLLVNHLADLVRVYTGRHGTTVRMYVNF